MFFTGSCCDCGCVQPESTMATPTIPASRVLVIFFIVFSLPSWLLLASFLNFGVAGTLLGWYPFLSLRGRGRREGPRRRARLSHFQGAATAFRAPPTVYERTPVPARFPPSTIRYSSHL